MTFSTRKVSTLTLPAGLIAADCDPLAKVAIINAMHSKNIEMIVIDPIRVSFVNLVIDVRDYGL